MYYVYILEDESGRLYKGQTINLKRRLQEHLGGHTKTTSKIKGKLKTKYYEKFETLNEALIRERYFKSAAGRRFIKKLLVNS